MAARDQKTGGEEDYQSYLLRLWRVTTDGKTAWRASLESPHTGKRRLFASLDALYEYLRANTSTDQERR